MIQRHVVTLSTKGQLVLPRAIRAAAGLHVGSKLSVTLQPDGTITAKSLRSGLEGFFQALDGLPGASGLDLDRAIQESVEELDRATRQR